MNYNILFAILKYIVLTIAIFSVLKYVLDYNMSNFDTIMTTTILVLLIILAETLYRMCIGENFQPMNKTNYCNSVCNKIENMDDVSSNKETDKNVDEAVDEAVEALDKTVKESDTDVKEPDTVVKEIVNTIKEPDTVVKEIVTIVKEPEKTMKEIPINNNIEREGDRYNDGVIDTENEYSDYNMLPMSDDNTGNFEYGYSFMPPEKWYPQPPHPPICVSNTKTNVMPIYTTGTPIDVKEWNESRRIMPPDNINTKYIKQKLNSGK
jgi:hypothetical protein